MNKFESTAKKKTIQAVGQAELAIVNYIDGRGDRKTQLLVVIDGGEQFWAFPKGTEESMRPANDWLAEQLRDHIMGASVAKERAKLAPSAVTETTVDVEPVDLPQMSMTVIDDDEEDE